MRNREAYALRVLTQTHVNHLRLSCKKKGAAAGASVNDFLGCRCKEHPFHSSQIYNERVQKFSKVRGHLL